MIIRESVSKLLPPALDLTYIVIFLSLIFFPIRLVLFLLQQHNIRDVIYTVQKPENVIIWLVSRHEGLWPSLCAYSADESILPLLDDQCGFKFLINRDIVGYQAEMSLFVKRLFKKICFCFPDEYFQFVVIQQILTHSLLTTMRANHGPGIF